MRFHAMLPVRDEADIIGQCLAHLLSWADAVYVFDTGSVDDTWEIVLDFAGRDRRIVPLGKNQVFFSDTRVRGWMFHQARTAMRDGDWFLRVDADEFHHVTPPEFVETHMRRHETIAFHQYYDFKLTASEVKGWDDGIETLEDRSRPIEQRRRRFTPSRYSEPRLCRYRSTMQWPGHASFPYNAGFVARARLPIRHYPHRDPVQLERRCRLRAAMLADKHNRTQWDQPEIHHWTQPEWRAFIVDDGDLNLLYWKPNADLPRFEFTTHLAKPHVRLLQYAAHRALLPLLDSRRPGWTDGAYPQPIPPEIVRLLATELSCSQCGDRELVT
jgi:glycosyltransferase involved in cell wall biosynthesis